MRNISLARTGTGPRNRPSAKGLAVFRDPNEIKRTATSINWHPEGPYKNSGIIQYSELSGPEILQCSTTRRIVHLGRDEPEYSRSGVDAAVTALLSTVQPEIN